MSSTISSFPPTLDPDPKSIESYCTMMSSLINKMEIEDLYSKYTNDMNVLYDTIKNVNNNGKDDKNVNVNDKNVNVNVKNVNVKSEYKLIQSNSNLYTLYIMILSNIINKITINNYKLEERYYNIIVNCMNYEFINLFNESQLEQLKIVIVRSEKQKTIFPLPYMSMTHLNDKYNIGYKNEIINYSLSITNRSNIKDIIKYDNSILLTLQGYILSLYPTAIIEIFGSRITNLGNLNSDIDISVQLPSDFKHKSHQLFCFNNKGSDVMEKYDFDAYTILSNLSELLKLKGIKSGKGHLLIKSKRVTVLKLIFPIKDANKSINIDICSRRGDEQRIKTYYLKEVFSIDPLMPSFLQAIKLWSKNRKLGDASMGGLNSYGWSLCVLFHLNKNMKFKHKEFIDDITSAFRSEQEVELPAHKNYYQNNDFTIMLDSQFGSLLLSFFHFFAYVFDYKNKRLSIKNYDLLPVDDESLEKLQLFNKEQFCCIWIEDILNPQDNIGRGVKKVNVLNIINESKRAYEMMLSGISFVDEICKPIK